MASVKIVSLEIFEYRLALKKSLRIKNHSLKSRRGFLIQITNEKKIVGFGEVAPLPGLSREDLNRARNQLFMLRENLVGTSIPSDVIKLAGQFTRWLGRFDLAPSVRFGIETAVLNLLANTKKTPLCRLFEPLAPKNISVSGLLQGSKTQVYQEARRLLARRYKSLKLKVGKESLETDIAKVIALRKIIRNRATLRLDANKAWDFKTAVRFGKTIGLEAIDYIEEPLHNPKQLSEFYFQTKLPIALDESLRKLKLRDIGRIKGLRAVILKPSVLGGFEATFKWIRAAKKLKIQSVISSSFESGVGQTALANLAVCCGNFSAGLDTLKWFRQDLVKSKRSSACGVLNINLLSVTARDINFKYLKPIKHA